MKKYLLITMMILIGKLLQAQSPLGFSYQAVLRNTDGQVIPNQNATLRISLADGDGAAYYTEIHSVTSTVQGLVNIVVGSGQDQTGTIAGTPWGTKAVFIKVEIKLEGQPDFTSMGLQPLQSVPYALFASAGNEGPQGEQGIPGQDGISLEWKGELASHPAEAQINWAYYNKTLKVAYVYSGTEWDTLAVDGQKGLDGAAGAPGSDGLSIDWLGSYPNTSVPTATAKNQAYHNTTDSTSYIWDGSSWQTLTAKGARGPKGDTGNAGQQGLPGQAGADGLSIEWLGSFPNTSIPTATAKNQAYHNTTDSTSYIWDGNSWQVIATKGAKGPKGDTGNAGPQGLTGQSGTDGLSIEWLGSFPSTSTPVATEKNQAYYNTTDSTSYIWNGAAWQTLVTKGPRGSKGEQGPQGATGVGLTLRGAWSADSSYVEGDYVFSESSLTVGVNSMWICQTDVSLSSTMPKDDNTHWVEFEAPEGPQGPVGPIGPTGDKGDVGTQGPVGSSGISVVWRGEYPSAPIDQSTNHAYYNTTLDKSYIWDGDSWEVLAQDGAIGAIGPKGDKGDTGAQGNPGLDGISIQWKGSLAVAPVSPGLNWAYYDTLLKKSFVWDGDSWEILAQDGEPGTMGSLVSGVEGQMLVHDGTNWTASSAITVKSDTVGIGTNAPISRLIVQGDATALPEDPIFEVKNKDGKVVLGVYNEGVRVYVADGGTKGVKGGFAVGGLTNQTKTGSVEYFRITPDSARIYVNETPIGTKGVKGGFAVGGLTNQTKLTSSRDLLFIAPDSARIYIKDTVASKGVKGGFAVGGLTNQTKGITNQYLYIHRDSSRIYIDDTNTKGVKGGFAVGGLTNQTKSDAASFMNIETQSSIKTSKPRILWYPLKNAFLVGQVKIESPDSVGLNSFASGYESKAKGIFSQALGYNSIARGSYSTAIGKNALAHTTNSFAFGDAAKAINTDAYSLGAGAIASGIGSYAFGSVGRDTSGNQTGAYTEASGSYSLAIGQGSKSSNLGSMSFGISNTSSGKYSLAIGHQATASSSYGVAIGLFSSATGSSAVAIGSSSSASGSGAFALKGGSASGVGAMALGFASLSSGENSVSLSATYYGGLAVGYWGAEATAYGSVAIGSIVKATGYRSIAIGSGKTHSGGLPVTYTGDYTNATGQYAIAIGRGVVAQAYASLAVGQFNAPSGTTSSWVTTDPLFVIGNGTDYNATSNAFTVLKNGKVGILNSTPTYTLDITGTARTTQHTYLATSSGYNVGIGTTTPTHKFHLGGEMRIARDATYDIWIQGGSSTVGDDRNLAVLGKAENSGDQLFINYDSEYANGTVIPGYVGIGSTTNNSSYKLLVYGNAGGTSWTNTSDIRWKKNIIPMGKVLSKIKELNGVKYEWKVDEFPKMNFDKRVHIGLIAQDLENVFPELVFTDVDGYKSVAYDKITAILIEGIKEQQIQLDSLREENDFLKEKVKEIDTLKAELDVIKQLLKK